MDRRSWQVIIHGVSKSWTQLSDWHFHTYYKGEVRRSSQNYKNLLPYLKYSKIQQKLTYDWKKKKTREYIVRKIRSTGKCFYQKTY